jgi:hypothetical protein
MPGFYPAVVKLRAYLLYPVESAAREKAWRRLVANCVAICKNRAGERAGSPWLVQVGVRHLAAMDIYIREHTNSTDNAIGRLADCTVPHNKTR